MGKWETTALAGRYIFPVAFVFLVIASFAEYANSTGNSRSIGQTAIKTEKIDGFTLALQDSSPHTGAYPEIVELESRLLPYRKI